ncbi:MAG: lipoyl(octanoyl) transferase LipB [Planctomycetota bacterium]
MAVSPHVIDWGHTRYADAHERMLLLAERVRKGEDPGAVILVEHERVCTAGRATPADELGPGVVPVARGGRITWHGPGQLVVYPVLRLPRRDVRDWLRRLEELGVAVCRSFGLAPRASVCGTGVYVGGMKIVSIGVAVQRWVNTHGLSINARLDADAFLGIRPCGLEPSQMSDLSRAVDREVSLAEVKAAVREHLTLLTQAPQPVS